MEWGKSRFTVLHMENNTVINKQLYKNKLGLCTHNCKPTFVPLCVMRVTVRREKYGSFILNENLYDIFHETSPHW